MNKKTVDVYVLAAGIVYGNGEMTLEPLFKSAWLEDPQALPVIGDGENHVPMVHVRDLARAVKHVIQTRPSKKYLFVVDSAPSQMQKDLISGISTGMGTGHTQNVRFEDYSSHNWAKALSLNIKIKPSDIFLPPSEEEKVEDNEESEVDEETGEAKPKKPKPIRMDWHCLKGLSLEIRRINQEFNDARGLKPISMFFTGPAGSGKSHMAKLLSSYYNIPRIHTEYVVSQITSQQSELGEEIRTKLAELKEEMLEEAENNKKEGEEIDPDSIKPRIPKDLLAKAFRWALAQNPCRNRGYILEGFPKTYEDCWSIFKVMPPPPVDEEGNAEEVEPDRSKMITDSKIFPQSVVHFYGNDAELIEKVKKLPEDVLANTHYNLLDMQRRLKDYRLANEDPTGLPSIVDFFEENDVKVLKLHCNANNISESCKIYLERFGKPVNYQSHDEEAEKARIRQLELKRLEKFEESQRVLKKHEEVELDKRIMKNEEIKKKIAIFQQREIDNIERLSEHVKGYMIENVLDVLSQGLFRVCSKNRGDPVDYLAKYLFKHSDGIPHPDPYLY
jgi:adenylate kinase